MRMGALGPDLLRPGPGIGTWSSGGRAGRRGDTHKQARQTSELSSTCSTWSGSRGGAGTSRASAAAASPAPRPPPRRRTRWRRASSRAARRPHGFALLARVGGAGVLVEGRGRGPRRVRRGLGRDGRVVDGRRRPVLRGRRRRGRRGLVWSAGGGSPSRLRDGGPSQPPFVSTAACTSRVATRRSMARSSESVDRHAWGRALKTVLRHGGGGASFGFGFFFWTVWGAFLTLIMRRGAFRTAAAVFTTATTSSAAIFEARTSAPSSAASTVKSAGSLMTGKGALAGLAGGSSPCRWGSAAGVPRVSTMVMTLLVCRCVSGASHRCARLGQPKRTTCGKVGLSP